MLLDLALALALSAGQPAGLPLQPGGPRACGGARLDPARPCTLATNEFLATGGDQPRRARIPATRIRLVDGAWVRELRAEWLRGAGPARVAAQGPWSRPGTSPVRGRCFRGIPLPSPRPYTTHALPTRD